jgi:DNA-binding NarL/FixJ family response regulator
MITPTSPVSALGSNRAERPSRRGTAANAASATAAPDALRLAAMAIDASSTTEFSLSLLWRELSRGISRVVDGFFSDMRCYLVLSLKTNASATPIEGRRLEILEAVLAGLRQKNIAMELTLAPSTVALNSRLALESLGVVGKPSRAHPLLMLSARAAAEPALMLARCSTLAGPDASELRVISRPRPDLALTPVLPAAEMAVIRSLVEGRSYREIARERGTSTRTVANQISAVFRRLRVSGRNELVQRLFFDDALGTFEPPRDTPVPPSNAGHVLATLESARRSA